MVAAVVLACAAGLLLPVHMALFPDNGGYTRTVIFARPRGGMPGYYVLIDEIRAPASWTLVELVFHGYGSLHIDGQSASWQVVGVSLNLTVATPAVSISKHAGKVYHSDQNETLEYVKVTPLQTGPCTVVTVLFPNNGSYTPPVVGATSTDGGVIVTVGNRDVLLVNDHPGTTFTHGAIATDAKALFCRMQPGEPGSVEYFVVYQGTSCNVSGLPTYVAGAPGTVAYLNGSGIVLENLNRRTLAPGASTPLTTNLGSLVHPYLLFNDTTLPALRARCNGTTPGIWTGWYTTLSARVQTLLAQPADDFTGIDCAVVAFAGAIEQNTTYIAKARDVLATLDRRQEAYRQLINRANDVVDFAMAFDCVFASIDVASRQDIAGNLEALALPLYDDMDIASLNNWRPVMAGGLGMSGLVLNKPTFVARAQEAVDFYLAECIRANGACFEGQSYLRYAWENALKFCLALRNLGGYDYVNSPKMLASLNFSVYSAAPDGRPPLYEDCTGSTLALEAMWTCGLVSDPVLGANLRWYADQTYWVMPEPYTLCTYVNTIVSAPPVAATSSVAFADDDYAFLRSGWDSEALCLAISSKDYLQSHVHYDENSIELWAYGQKMLSNGGYPGYKDPGHAWTVDTESSNNVLIGGEGQMDQRANGIQAAMLTPFVELVSADAFTCYRHPYSLAAQPVLLATYIVLIAGLVLVVFLLRGARHGPQGTNDSPAGSHAPNRQVGLSWRDAWGALKEPFRRSPDLGMLAATPSAKQRFLSIAAVAGAAIVPAELLVAGLEQALDPFSVTFASSGNYNQIIVLYDIAKVVIPFLFAAVCILGSWMAKKLSAKLYIALIHPRDEEGERRLANVVAAGDVFGAPLALVAVPFVAWWINPALATTIPAAFIHAGEVQVVMQYFFQLIGSLPLIMLAIFLAQVLVRAWQARFLSRAFQDEGVLGSSAIISRWVARRFVVLVVIIAWLMALLLLVASTLPSVAFLGQITIESF
jgi:hypothetical protein